jgi:type IV pilus assembly protein PilP
MKTTDARCGLRRRHLGLAFVAVLLAGCGGDGEQEMLQWMDEVKRQTPVSVQKISEPKTFVPFSYSAKEEVDPYSPAKLQIALAKAQASSKSSIRPDLDRRKEPLEHFPLDTITMVGTVAKPGLTYALLRVDGNVFQVKVGNHIGQNFGQVIRITESEVELREIVRDASGEWTDRRSKLELQESGK